MILAILSARNAHKQNPKKSVQILTATCKKWRVKILVASNFTHQVRC